jgi:hypothetical protein
MCVFSDAFVRKWPVKEDHRVYLADSSTLQVYTEGTVRIPLLDGEVELELKDVLYVPRLTRSLFSVDQAMDQGISVIFDAARRECRLETN